MTRLEISVLEHDVRPIYKSGRWVLTTNNIDECPSLLLHNEARGLPPPPRFFIWLDGDRVGEVSEFGVVSRTIVEPDPPEHVVANGERLLAEYLAKNPNVIMETVQPEETYIDNDDSQPEGFSCAFYAFAVTVAALLLGLAIFGVIR